MATVMTAAANGTTTTSRRIGLPVAITVLVGATALTHLFLGVMTQQMASNPAIAAPMGGYAALMSMAVIFYLNFAGYVALNVALYLRALRKFRRVARFALMGYAALTIVAYFALAQGHYDVAGMADKAIEGALIVLLVIENRRSARVTD